VTDAARTPRVSRTLLNQETDARFWAQTHYKIGQPLNTKDPTDSAMSKVWRDIFASVQKEDREGRLRVTYNDPEIQALLASAATATAATQGHLAAATAAVDPESAAQHVAAAAQAGSAATAQASAAAARQPATVSPLVVQAAATEAARATGTPPPAPVVFDLPPNHPAVTSPAARPMLSLRDIVRPTPESAPPTHPNHEDHPAAPPPPRDPLAEARAREAPVVAVAVHEAAARRPDPAGTTPPDVIAHIRESAADNARRASGDFVGTILLPIPPEGDMPEGQAGWATTTFPTPEDAATWFDDHGQDGVYAAHYDKTGPIWPRPVEETLGHTSASVMRRLGQALHKNPVVPILIGGVVLLGLAAIATSRSGSGAP
jgi:hypothetical protein